MIVGQNTFSSHWTRSYNIEFLGNKELFEREIKYAVENLKDLEMPDCLLNFVEQMVGDVTGQNRTDSVSELLNHKWISNSKHTLQLSENRRVHFS